MRESGVLLPVFSLPGEYGIGCFSREAYRFVDFLREAGQSCWQILPLGPTGYGDSPYQAFSTFAGNPYFISLERLIEEGLLTRAECESADLESEDGGVDYGKLYAGRLALLRLACGRSDFRESKDYRQFVEDNEYWLPDYALFMALKDAHGGASLSSWEEDIRTREEAALEEWREKLSADVDYYQFLQYVFFTQWRDLKDYANGQGIRIIGDIPIYVSADSADFWAHPELFRLDERGRVRQIAGVPPDGFSADGQVWGNPLYDWDFHRRTGYEWWKRRIGKCLELYDVIRIDHFRGFDEYFAVPADETTARNGRWEKGPGISLFESIRAQFGEVQIIAEDLGYVTDTVRQLVRDAGFPNMKVLEFAFDSRDSTGASEYRPYNYNSHCVVYTGTHDNETLRGWMDSILPEELSEVREYLDVRTDDPQEVVRKMVLAAQSSVAELCVIPLQDWLGLDNSARINQPNTMGRNWHWRVKREQLTPELAAQMRRATELYGRRRAQ